MKDSIEVVYINVCKLYVLLNLVFHATMIKRMQCFQCVGNVFYYLYGDVKLFLTMRFLYKYYEKKKTLITISFKQYYIDKWNTTINTTTKWNIAISQKIENNPNHNI